jgi:hypothetical protein
MSRIEELILKYARHGILTDEEQAILDEWQSRSIEHSDLPEKFRDEKWIKESLTRLSRIPSEQIWTQILEQVTIEIKKLPVKQWGAIDS